ncbi:MAG TPA: patatin-like phospholipase family protein [Steroidobacteraceae bacterium]|nr:patatin-like phospholipase family protein [Steroidobacteraceae bacterium]
MGLLAAARVTVAQEPTPPAPAQQPAEPPPPPAAQPPAVIGEKPTTEGSREAAPEDREKAEASRKNEPTPGEPSTEESTRAPPLAPSQPGGAAAAEPHRPRIGLVLSGGGARGAAHIGVLKVLEDLHVPIDAIAGTSMGAVVGGLYASGFSARDIERIVSTLNWQDAFKDRPPREELTFRRKQEDQNFLVKFPLGLRSRHFQLPKGLIQGQKLNQELRKLTLPVARITDFDQLPTPFRAVATDLETGEAVIMGSGDLTSAMRASLSAPGVFSPVEREGRLLVDGGLSENLPIDVARSMNVDVLIVVDVGFPLLKRDKLTSAPVISNQMLAILVRRNSDRQRATLTSRDIVIDPPLGDASSFDFGVVTRNIAAGERAALAATRALSAYSISQDDYSIYTVKREDIRRGTPVVQFVRVEPGSERYAEALEKLFGDVVGKPVDADALSKRVTGYYGKGNLEALDYQLVKDGDDRYGLAVSARRNSWGPNYVRFGLNLQDDFEGNSSYNAAARFVLSEITQPGGEWVWDLQEGDTSRIATEIYLPFSQSEPYFIMPHAELEARNVAQVVDQDIIREYRVRSFGYGIDVGREFGNWGEVRFGLRWDKGTTHVRVGDPLPTTRFDTNGYFTRLSYDRLDDVNFPRHGTSVTLEWDGQRVGLGEDRTADRLSFNWITARTFGRQTGVLWTSFGTALNKPSPDVRTLFQLGGFLNLSGLKADSLADPHYGITRLLLYRQIGRGGPGFLDVPAYLGVSLEAGNVWPERGDASFGSLRKDASVFLGLDTPLGPVYVATGFDQHGGQAFYLFLGRTF